MPLQSPGSTANSTMVSKKSQSSPRAMVHSSRLVAIHSHSNFSHFPSRFPDVHKYKAGQCPQEQSPHLASLPVGAGEDGPAGRAGVGAGSKGSLPCTLPWGATQVHVAYGQKNLISCSQERLRRTSGTCSGRIHLVPAEDVTLTAPAGEREREERKQTMQIQ